MEPYLWGLPRIVLALAATLAVSGLVAWTTHRRGGRFRGLPGWVGFWFVFAGILVSLSRLPRGISLTMLGLLMFAALRTHFFLAPMRPRDRYAMLAAYLAIPFTLFPGFTGSESTFLATVPIILFLLLPVLLSTGRPQEGLLESIGRFLLGVLLFVFCTAHLGLLAGRANAGLLELFGMMVLAAELPGRLTGRFRQGGGWVRSSFGVVAGGILAAGVGFWAGPWCGLEEEDGARAGLLVTFAVTMGALVAEAVIRDLSPASTPARTGRWAFLDRAIPAVYAAPVFFHYLNHFAS
jgi:predicted CDP-diglyceride synthetase/phosphatidate cytidylyltransferase